MGNTEAFQRLALSVEEAAAAFSAFTRAGRNYGKAGFSKSYFIEMEQLTNKPSCSVIVKRAVRDALGLPRKESKHLSAVPRVVLGNGRAAWWSDAFQRQLDAHPKVKSIVLDDRDSGITDGSYCATGGGAYTFGTDYEVNWRTGGISALPGGLLASGATVAVSYSYKMGVYFAPARTGMSVTGGLVWPTC